MSNHFHFRFSKTQNLFYPISKKEHLEYNPFVKTTLIYLRKGNPLAVNYAEWLMLTRYLVPTVNYGLFDRSKMEIAHLNKINNDLWDELLTNSDQLLIKSKFEDVESVTLGKVQNDDR